MAKYLDETGAEQLNQLLAAKFDTKVDKVLITKTYTEVQGSGDNGSANYAFYYMSVKPNSYTEPWSIKYRIHVWIPGKTNFDAVSNSFFIGDQSSINAYALFNHFYSTSYRPVYYQSVNKLTSDGFNAGYGHAFAMNMADSHERTTSGYARNFTIEVYEIKNCTVTLLDTPVLWANWEGTGDTYYNAVTNYNFSGNGLQETGDANDNTIAYIIKSYYERTKVGPNKLFQYNLCTYTSGDKLEGFVNSASTGTTKTKNTSSFKIGAPIYYYSSKTNLVQDNVAGDNTLFSQNSTVDLRYSTNCAKTLSANLPVYLVGIPSGATFTLADTWWTQTLPNTEDGKIYILLGIAYTTYQIAFNMQHPVYEYKNGTIRLYQVPVTSSEVTTALGYTPYSAENPNGYTSNTGTITKVQANGTDIASSGTANIPAASTSAYGVTELSSATNSTSEALAATPKAVKAAYDLAASKGTGTITGVSVNGTSVATSGVANITSVPASILSGAIPSAVTATTQTQGDNSTKIATTAYVDAAIDNLPDPMIFKGSLGTGGTITALPVDGSANIGDTYKVITAGTYASKAAKVGDTFICLTKTSSANTWELIPSGDEPAGTVTSVTIKATSPISIDSSAAITSSGTRTLSHANSGVTAGNYKSVTVNATGHVTAGENPTTLAGYGITDAKIASGVITLGSNTITPLTSASTLDATKLSGTIPSDCYTDTKNTAGSTDSSSKLFLIGATSQTASSQTYSQDTAYVGTDGKLYSNSKEVVNLSDTQALTNKTYNGYTLAAASAKAVDTSISAGSSSANLPTSAAVATFVEGKGYVTTDTKNTAGATSTNATLYLIGSISQTANPQTYTSSVKMQEGKLSCSSLSAGSENPTGDYSVAEGYSTKATANQSHAEGCFTAALEQRAHAEGYNSIAAGDSSHAEGDTTIAIGGSSHSEGSGRNAVGNIILSGAANATTYTTSDTSNAKVGYRVNGAGGAYITAISTNQSITLNRTLSSSSAISNKEYAITSSVVAFSSSSHAEGLNTYASRSYQHVQGKYNIIQDSSSTLLLDIVGNGSEESNRSNAYTLDINGNGWFSGNVYVGSTGGKNKDGGSKKLITADEISTSINAITPAQIDAIFAI